MKNYINMRTSYTIDKQYLKYMEKFYLQFENPSEGRPYNVNVFYQNIGPMLRR